MAATTPVILAPIDAETGVSLTAPLKLIKDAYSGAGTQRECRWQIDTAVGFDGTRMLDTLLRENDDLIQGDDWREPYPEAMGLQPSTQYFIRCQVRNTSDETSSFSTVIDITMEATKVSAAAWGKSQ